MMARLRVQVPAMVCKVLQAVFLLHGPVVQLKLHKLGFVGWPMMHTSVRTGNMFAVLLFTSLLLLELLVLLVMERQGPLVQLKVTPLRFCGFAICKGKRKWPDTDPCIHVECHCGCNVLEGNVWTPHWTCVC